jgi:tetratricopeptide (TPR) repeat protein
MNITPPRSNEPLRPFAETAEERIEALRLELEASTDRTRQAVVQYEIGHLTEHVLGNEAQAVREYLGAYNLDSSFRPPLIALVSIFERRRSFKNLLRLYDAEARSATSAREAASALADRAVLMADHLEGAGDARGLLETALSQAGEAQEIALLLEHQLLAEGDRDAAIAVMAQRAELVKDPVLATLLRLEVARHKEEAGDVEGALALLRSAVTTPAARWRVLEHLERVARQAGRHPERIVALEGRAKLAAATARGEDQGQGSGAFSVQRFADQARASAEAAALYREAARLRLTALNDPTGARRDYDAALDLRPDDALLRYERMLACELGGDLDAAAGEARRLLADGVDGPAAAALHFRLAEQAQAHDRADESLAHMRDALSADPGSAAAAALLDDLLRGVGDVGSAVEQLAARAEQAEGPVRAQRAWEAAQLAADVLGDFARARPLYDQAVAAAEDPTPILREQYGAALRLGDADGARASAEALLSRELDGEERSALLRELHELMRSVLEDHDAADDVLRRALDDEAATWAPELARLHGVLRGNAALASRAHRALAERASDAEAAAAHLCAAARMQMRGGDADGAVETLREALRRSASHPYAVALLEEVLRARGDADELVRLLKEAAEASDAPRAAEARLLLAGAEAEAADDVAKALQMYEEAADRDPTSVGPLFALKRLADSRGDRELLLRALEALSQRELADGEPGRFTLALGEHYDLVSGSAQLAEAPLSAALESDALAPFAAVDLALLPGADPHVRRNGVAQLLDRAGGEARLAWLREAVGNALEEDDASAAVALVEELRERAPRDPAGHLAALRLAGGRADRAADRAEAWLALGHSTDDPDVAGELLLHGLRANVIARGDAGIDDGVILAHEVMAVAPGSLEAAVALDETLSAGDDPDGRADALGSWIGHGGTAGRLAMESARGRALAAAGRAREGLEVLLRVAASEPDDLASWEAIRVCARDCQAWEPLVEACDRLAHLMEDPELAILLLEESAAVLMDELHQDGRAERRLRRVLAMDAKRPIAYGRLHDILADREDDAGLLDLVSARIELVDDPEELGKLFYEQARLFRSLGMREEALATLDNLLMLESEHLGGLALLVEIQVQKEDWAGAVETLRTLAGAEDVPDSQRRIARLGAADFLQGKLEDREGALDELLALDEAGLSDRPILERIVTLAEQVERWDAATAALAKLAAMSDDPEDVARYERRAGYLHAEHRDDRDAAIDAYARALSIAPTDAEAAQALSELLDEVGRQDLSHRFEAAVRRVLERDPTDPECLRKLRRAAAWRGDRVLDMVALSTLVGLGLADGEEAEELEDHTQLFARSAPTGALDDAAFQLLRTPGDGDAPFAFAAAVAETVAEMDELEPNLFGLGRNDTVRPDHPVRNELNALCGLLGVPAPEVWQGGNEPGRIDVMPYYKGRPNIVIGGAVQTPLSLEQRFVLGRLVAGLRLGVAPLVRRDPQRAATALFAAAAAGGAPLAAGEGRAGMAEASRRAQKVMSRKVRKVVPDQARLLGDGRVLDGWARLVHRTVGRAGLMLCADLATALRLTLGHEPDRASVLGSPEARDLLNFWLSPEALVLRQKLGLST